MKKDRSPVRKLERKIIWMVHLIILGSVITFSMIEFVAYRVLRHGEAYKPTNALGMLMPMGLLLGLIAAKILKHAEGYFTRLLEGISRVADGDFSSELDTGEAGPFAEIFQDFNKMTRELKGVQSLRNDFVNQFSHEFKTPIMSINGFASLMLEDELPREEQKRYLEIICSESKRLSELSGNTLLLAKLESQQWLLNRSVYLLDEQIRECLILLEPEWERKNLDINAELERVFYSGNREIMSQLWINLIGNAVRYTPDEGKVSVALSSSADELTVTVKDSGHGIAPEELPLIFNKYYKGRDSGRGLGLGLSIVKRITDLCGGRIEISSEINAGSSFTVHLPTRE